MANIYVRSTDGLDADTGATWALAKATGTGAAAIDAAGDTIYFSQVHSETSAALVNWAIAGTLASPTRLLCVNDSAEPPTALATGATIATTGASNIVMSGIGYHYGLTFLVANGSSNGNFQASGAMATFKNCSFQIRTTSAAAVIGLANAVGGRHEYYDCTFKFAAASQGISTSQGGTTKWYGGSLLSGGTSPTALITAASGDMEFNGLDLTNASAAINLCSSAATALRLIFRDCKLPASWSGVLCSATPGQGSLLEMFNCDSGDTHYRYRRAVYTGAVQEETTLVRTGGASDGATTYSFKLVSNTNAAYPLKTLSPPEIVKWNDTVGSAITATVEILFDSATALNNDEVWLDVMYLGTSGFPLASFTSSAKADVLATAAATTSSATTWTTTGMTNPNKRKLAVTFTPQEAGFIHATVKLAKASTTVYVDPMMTVT